MGGGRGKNRSRSRNKAKPRKLTGREKAQQMAKKNIAKYGGTASAAAANRARGRAAAKSRYQASQAAKNEAKKAAQTGGFTSKSVISGMPSYSSLTSKSEATKTFGPSAKTGPSFNRSNVSGIGPFADGSKYAQALGSPTRFNTKGSLLASDYSSGEPTPRMQRDMARDILNSGMKLSDDQTKKLMQQATMKLDTAYKGLSDGDLVASNIFQKIGDRYLNNLREKNADPEQNKTGTSNFFNNSNRIQQMLNEQNQSSIYSAPGTLISATGDLSGLTIGAPKATGFTPSIGGLAESLGLDPTTGQDATTTTAGGLNIGGTATMKSDPTGRAVNAYDSSLNPDSFKGLSDGETFGSGPVASGDAYARGLNVDNKNVENMGRSILNRLPGVNLRKLTDKEIADRRVKAKEFREKNLKGRKGSGGTRAIGATPTVIEELLPEAVPIPTRSTTPTTQTGIDPNRLLQIQQQAYAQAYNPMTIGGFNPQFRFGGRSPRIDYSTYFNY